MPQTVQAGPVILAAKRTPMARSKTGPFSALDAADLATLVVRDLLEALGPSSNDVDDIVLAESLQGGGVIARYVALRLGFAHLPGIAVNRHCAGSLSALVIANALVEAGVNQAVIAGGTESFSVWPSMRRAGPDGSADPWFPPTHPDTSDAPSDDMTITVGHNAAQLSNLERSELDAWAVLSHQRAAEAADAGMFINELISIPIEVPGGPSLLIDSDTTFRRGINGELAAKLPLLHPEIPGFGLTALSSSPMTDGAAALLVASRKFAAEHEIEPLARLRGSALVGVMPSRTGVSPAAAIEAVLHQTQLSLGDIKLFEINEAFASVPLAAQKTLSIPTERLNTLGSGCSLGHPIAATGARMATTMIWELRRRGGGLGCIALCIGGGMGIAAILEV